MENLIVLAVPFVTGLVVGYLLAKFQTKKPAPVAEPETVEPVWWELRQKLTGTQVKILEYMEANREASMTTLQEEYSFIPDRELYYRLEQIALMGFISSVRRQGGEVFYVLNSEYSETIEDDKTVFLSEG